MHINKGNIANAIVLRKAVADACEFVGYEGNIEVVGLIENPVETPIEKSPPIIAFNMLT